MGVRTYTMKTVLCVCVLLGLLIQLICEHYIELQLALSGSSYNLRVVQHFLHAGAVLSFVHKQFSSQLLLYTINT